MFKRIKNNVICLFKKLQKKNEEKKTIEEKQFEEGLKNIIDY